MQFKQYNQTTNSWQIVFIHGDKYTSIYYSIDYGYYGKPYTSNMWDGILKRFKALNYELVKGYSDGDILELSENQIDNIDFIIESNGDMEYAGIKLHGQKLMIATSPSMYGKWVVIRELNTLEFNHKLDYTKIAKEIRR